MLRLRLLGSQELERTDGADASEVFAQPKPFALLAYLACRTDGFLRRDTLLAVFWPELDTFAARRALRNALYQLRQALGEEPYAALHVVASAGPVWTLREYCRGGENRRE